MTITLTTDLAKFIREECGENVYLCYQCERCSSGCPTSMAMHYRPAQMMRIAQFGLEERLITDASLWRCLGCDTCTAHCPHNLSVRRLVEVMRQIWIQQYYLDDGQLKWREQKDLPPGHLYIQSPDDPDTRNRTKRDINWTGYTVHVTETCDQDNPNLITHVETRPASTGDVSVTADIHIALAEKQLLPSEHFVDAGYTSADHLVISHTDYHLDLMGPVMSDSSWQAKAGQGFDIAHFVIDWQSQTATCPTGKRSQGWHSGQWQGQDFIQIRFAPPDCRACQHRSCAGPGGRGYSHHL